MPPRSTGLVLGAGSGLRECALQCSRVGNAGLGDHVCVRVLQRGREATADVKVIYMSRVTMVTGMVSLIMGQNI